MGNPAVSEWLDFMADTVQIAPFVSRSVSGVPTYGPPVSFPCYIEMKSHLVVDRQGREVVARGRVFMGTTVTPNVEDSITLPAGYEPLSPPIISVNIVNDDQGNHHVTLEIG